MLKKAKEDYEKEKVEKYWNDPKKIYVDSKLGKRKNNKKTKIDF